MDYLSILATDPDFMALLWAGAIPFLIVGDLKWAAAWIITIGAAWGLIGTWRWEVFWVILILAYANSKMVGLLSAISGGEDD